MISNAYPMQVLAVVLVTLGTLVMAPWVSVDGKLSASTNLSATDTARAGETLRADASGISDTNDRTDTEFNDRWVVNDVISDTELSGATDYTYTLVAADALPDHAGQVIFADDARHTETLTSAATDPIIYATQQNTVNHSPTGTPTIDGTAQVGATLRADTGGIDDGNGLDAAVFSYQWLRASGGVDLEISGATGSTYTLVDDDAGNTIKVRVSFTDDDGNDHHVTSAATGVVAAADQDASRETAIDLGDITGFSKTRYPTHTINGADDRVDYFRFTITQPKFVTSGIRQLDRDASVTLEDGDGEVIATKAQAGAEHVMLYGTRLEGTYYIRVEATEEGANEYRLAHGVRDPNPDRVEELRGTPEPETDQTKSLNHPPTGTPTIDGTAQVGATLRAETGGIDDGNGMDAAVFSYQWLRASGGVDSEIQGATGSTYTLVDEDAGNTIKVRVSFTDDDGNDHHVTSAASDTVIYATQQNTVNHPPTGMPTIDGTAQVGATLRADTEGIDDGNGLDAAVFSYQWLRASGGVDLEISGATGSTYTLVDDDAGNTIKVRVSFTDDDGNDHHVTSAASDTVIYATQQNTVNHPPTGMPTIDGTAQVGATLRADTGGIDDGNGLDAAVFSYQWLRASGGVDLEISGATGSTYTLVDDDAGNTIKVRVSFTDDDGNDHHVTSAATGVVAAADQDASRETAIDLGDITGFSKTRYPTHTINGADDRVDYFRFTITQPKFVTSGIRQLDRDASVTLEDGDGEVIATKAQAGAEHVMLYGTRLEGTYYIRVEATEEGANEYRLAHGVRDPNPDRVEELRGTPEPETDQTKSLNHPPTGTPTIDGTAQVGATLRADTGDIDDGNGLDAAVFSYQWLRASGGVDSEIQGATGSTYTLVDEDAGNTIKVRVSFTDDDGNDHHVTSAATDTILLSAEQDSSVSEPSDGDLPDNTTTTGVLAIGGTVSGNVGEGRDVDWFAIELTEGAYYKFTLHGNAMASKRVTIRGLADANGSYVTPKPGTYRWSAIHWKPSKSGTFYLDVGPYQGNRSGDYTLSAQLIETAQDAIPANTTTEAQVNVGGSRLYAIQTAHDHDWIKVDFEQGVRYRVLLEVVKQPGRWGWADMFYPALVQIRDPDGDPIANTSNVYSAGTGLPGWWRQDSAETYYRATESGTYYIVAGSSVNTTGIFRVKVFQTTDDDYSADTLTTATVTVDGDAVGGKIEVKGDEDWFKASLTSGKTYKVDVLGSYADGGNLRWPDLTGIYDSSGVRFANTQNYDHGYGSTPRKYFIASQTGEHFIGVRGYSSTLGKPDAGTYKVSLEEVHADIPHDDTTTASLTVDGKVYGHIDRLNDEDWYQVVLEANKAYTVKVGNDRFGASDMRVRNLYESDADVILDLGGGHRKPRTYYDYQWYFEPSAAGTYYVSVDSRSSPDGQGGYLGAPTGPFWIEVKDVPFDIPGDETSTTSATLNGRYTGVFEIKNDQDWYTFTGDAGKGYFVAGIPYSFIPPGRGYDWGVPIVGIYDSSGAKLPNTSDPWYRGGVYFEPSSTATYYVALEGSYLYPVTTYHVDLYETELDQPANTSTTATVSVGGTYSGWIQGYAGGNQHDRDWIKMTLVANEEYAIHMKGLPTGDGTLEVPYIEGIYDSSGTLIDGTKDGDKGRNALVNFTPNADGDYYINAGWRKPNYDSPIFGSYTVEVVDVDNDGI